MGSEKQAILDAEGLQALLTALKARGYRVIGPTLSDQAVIYDDIETLDELPRGWRDEQDGGHYRLVESGEDRFFDFVVGPQSWKKFLHPPQQTLWRARREGEAVTVTPEPAEPERFAFIGVRSCEIHAIAIQDRVLIEGPHADPHYRARRQDNFIVAVNCARAAGTCFCASMNTGPKAESGFDLALTEIDGPEGPLFVAESASAAGEDLLGELPRRPATPEEVAAGTAAVAATARSMGREMPAEDLRDLLLRNLEHPRWEEVAERCLTCANCTMVCPTCFCTSVEDASDLTGQETSRSRRWDSCFTLDYSYIHGGSVRSSTQSRYRQWMTHKLATWHDQFDSSGCVGCGRCITWCPVGIDITEEVRAIRDSERDPVSES
ncbi:4Fe-4S dicluster domain-containing protein [Pelagibius marinus]|uniref:4Fe-4S dicluster domain-containing protein n=1 Tax=Pelagibius marinus TaxID=2762760 RepID=UPI001872FC8A|nr:4Fe-4S dicluster domain-containing protein [Pelagibius marinus]